MADLNKTATVTVNMVDNTKGGLASLGSGLKEVEHSSTSLTGALTGLGAIGIALFAGHELLDFFSKAGELAHEDELQTTALNLQLSRLGQTLVQTNPQLQQFLEYMLKNGQTNGETEQSLNKLIRATNNVGEAITLSKLASDAAASGVTDLMGATDALAGLFNGRARQAAAAFGLNMKENVTAGEALTAIMAQVGGAVEKVQNTNAQQTKIMEGQWEELMGKIGGVVTYIKGTVATAVNNVIDESWHDKLIDMVKYIGGPIGLTGALDSLKDHAGEAKAALDAVTEQKKLEDPSGMKQILADLKASQDRIDAANKEQTAKDDAAKAEKEYAKNLVDSFKSVSKSIVSAVNDQENAIDNLRKSEKDLQTQLDQDVDKSNEKYKEDVTNLARTAKQKADDLQKQIDQENSTKSEGYRTRIQQLQADMAKEQAIIDKAGGVVTDIQAKAAEDDFDVLTDSHTKDLKEIQDTAAKKKKLADDEIAARTTQIKTLDSLVDSKGFYKQASTQGVTFAGTIGAGSIQNVINFTFNGDVSDIDTLKAQVIASLNRTANLKGISGK